MILQALWEYYDRMAADPDSDIAPEGWEWKEIPFIAVINTKGKFLYFDDMRSDDDGKKRAKRFLVPQGEKKTSGITANLLWDTSNYLFGVEDRRGEDQKKAFYDRIEKELPSTEKKAALLKFLSNVNTPILEKSPYWADILKTKPNISFRFDTEFKLYCQSAEVKRTIEKKIKSKKTDGICMVSGEPDKISVTHTAIKGVWNAQSSGANIVSFNFPASYFFGKKQGQNAPIGETTMFAYTTALNTLLASKQRIQVGDASTVFWSARETKFEDNFPLMFSEPPKDDPNANTEAIKDLFDMPKTGAYRKDDSLTKFFVLGLSPNAARISIRFWKPGTVGEFANKIRQHFIDTEIIKPPNEPQYYSLWRILVNTAVQDKSENIPPHIAGDFMRSILDGQPYPVTLLQSVLRRIKSDGPPREGNSDRWGANKPVRAALIKAYLNRYIRAQQNSHEKELTMELDREQESEGYRLGRLFAVLEKIQEEGNSDIKATIRERFYSAACSAPVTVFPTLMRLKNHHLAKLENKGRVINFERLIGEILKKPFDDFPAHLNLHDQGKFAIGYYHQRQDLFTKKDK